MFSKVILSIITLYLSGCALATGPRFNQVKATEGSSLVYVYRKDLGHWQSAYSPTVVLDEKDIASLPREGYLVLNVSPEEHTFGFKHNFFASYKPVKIKLNMLPNRTYYLKISDPIRLGRDMDPNTITSTFISEIIIMEELTALKELATTRQISPIK